jgi:F-box domain
MQELPLEIVMYILEKLNPYDYYAASLFCENWNRAVNDSYKTLVLKLCDTTDWRSAAKRIAESYTTYFIYCFECSNKVCRSLGLPKKCPKCGGKIRTGKTELSLMHIAT